MFHQIFIIFYLLIFLELNKVLLSLDSQKKKKEKGNKCLNAVVKIDFF